MINHKNKHLLFELLYRYEIENESLEEINLFINYLKKELYAIEASDIASLKLMNLTGNGRWNGSSF